MQPGRALLPDSQGRNLKIRNPRRKQVLPPFLPVPILRKRPWTKEPSAESSLGGHRVETWPRLAGRTLGLSESKFTRMLLGLGYQTLGMGSALLTCSKFSDVFWPLQKHFSGKQEGTGGGGESRLYGRRLWPGEVVLQPEDACHVFSKRVPRTRDGARAGSNEGSGADCKPTVS